MSAATIGTAGGGAHLSHGPHNTNLYASTTTRQNGSSARTETNKHRQPRVVKKKSKNSLFIFAGFAAFSQRSVGLMHIKRIAWLQRPNCSVLCQRKKTRWETSVSPTH